MELKELTIKELLSDNILVIPEIQREYVWGSNKEVLSKFLSELNSSLGEIPTEKLQEIKPSFDEKDTVPEIREKLNSSLQKVNNYYETNIGFLYSYDAGNNEHYIIDGQQRLTTIVLLVYYYAVKYGRVSEFKTLLKTETPLIHFSYRVRPLTEQFLQNLFNDKDITSERFEKLKEAKWYVSDYDNDKTIVAICNLYKFICDEKKSFSDLNYDSLLQRVKFYYFDVQQTSQGEELYITMNSRGEQLKDSEQIKPYILEKMEKEEREEAAKNWDEREEYLYIKLKDTVKEINEDEVSKIDIAMDNIIKITLELYGEKIEPENDKDRKRSFDEIKADEDSRRIDFSRISAVIDNIKLLIDSKNDEIQKLDFVTFLFTKKRDENSLYLFESLIKSKELNFDDKNIHRLIRLLNNSWSYEIIKHNHIALLRFLSKMEKTADIYQYINSHQDIVNDVFINVDNKEELYKIQAILGNKISETEIEAAEALPVFSGKIHLLYRDLSGEISWNQFDKKLLKAKILFGQTGNKAIKEDEYVEFVHKFISAFSEWGQLAYNKCFFNNDLGTWQKILTDYAYLIPLNNTLELNPNISDWKNENTKAIWECLRDSVKDLVTSNPKGRLYWYGKVLAFYPSGGGNYSNSIVFDWGNFKRNQCLNGLLKDGTIAIDESIRIGKFFKGWDVRFSCNQKNYVWTWQNEIKCGKEVVITPEILKDLTSEQIVVNL